MPLVGVLDLVRVDAIAVAAPGGGRCNQQVEYMRPGLTPDAGHRCGEAPVPAPIGTCSRPRVGYTCGVSASVRERRVTKTRPIPARSNTPAKPERAGAALPVLGSLGVPTPGVPTPGVPTPGVPPPGVPPPGVPAPSTVGVPGVVDAGVVVLVVMLVEQTTLLPPPLAEPLHWFIVTASEALTVPDAVQLDGVTSPPPLPEPLH